MSCREMSWALSIDYLPTEHKFVLLAIADNASFGESVVTDSDLSRYTNIPEAAIQDYVEVLALHGLIDIEDGVYYLACGPEPISPRIQTKKPIPKQLRSEVFRRDGRVCLRCGCDDINRLRADHVIPESKGGETSLDNLQTLCDSCNSWKGTKTFDFRGVA